MNLNMITIFYNDKQWHEIYFFNQQKEHIYIYIYIYIYNKLISAIAWHKMCTNYSQIKKITYNQF
jgi:hypothetical protein